MKMFGFVISGNSISPSVRILVAIVLMVGISTKLAVRAGSLRASKVVQEQRLMEMRRDAQEILLLRSTGVTAKAVDPTSLGELERSAEASGLRSQMTSMTQNGADGLVVTLQGASFNRVVAWLDDLRLTKGVRVQRASLESAPETGTVSARLVLQ